MLTCMLRVVLLFVLASQSFGCKSSYITQIEWGHHISVDEEGRARGDIRKAGQVDFKYEAQLNDEEFQTQYVDSILKKLEEHVLKQKEESRLPAQILIFIHGGLNSYEGGLEHIDNVLESANSNRRRQDNLEIPKP